MASDPILAHTCCAPCLCALLEPLEARSGPFTAFFYNPNIHPLIEFRRRLKAFLVMADQGRFPVIADGRYGLDPFLDAIGTHRQRPERCRACYAMRLEAAAACAAARGFPVFTSTLLVSPQQDRDALCQLGRDAADRHGVTFDDSDYRDRHDAGLAEARRRNLYRQQYCGCIFSEHERYEHTTRHLYRPQSPQDQATDPCHDA